jgi:ABC-type dipeptide/oligopeptide/nickel transport system permease component
MKKFVLKRFLQMALVWILVSMFAFAIIYFAPGDPLYMYMTPGATGHKLTEAELQAMRESLGLTGAIRVSPLHVHDTKDVDDFLKVTADIAKTFAK